MTISETDRSYTVSPEDVGEKTNGKNPVLPGYQRIEGGFTSEKSLLEIVSRIPKDSGDEKDYSVKFLRFGEDNPQGLEPGFYCQTNVTPEEWIKNKRIRYRYGALIIEGLIKTEQLKDRNYLRGNPSYLDPGGNILIRIEVGEKPARPQ